MEFWKDAMCAHTNITHLRLYGFNPVVTHHPFGRSNIGAPNTYQYQYYFGGFLIIIIV